MGAVASIKPARRRQAANTPRQPLGRGRSGVVYRQDAPEGKLAVKVFLGDTLGDLVHRIAFGAPNPYSWSGPAVRCALYRRNILALLVPYWFGERLQVADATQVLWNQAARAWELHTRYVKGYPAALHHPFSASRDHEQVELRDKIMRPLQHHLDASGFDGLVWQAGHGNPVAANNFLVIERRRGSRGAADTQWAWIDLESGVPALFPADPRPLFTYYLPRSFQLGRPLFDDVDVERLLGYVGAHADDIDAAVGDGGVSRVRQWACHLRDAQQEWKSLPRRDRSLHCAMLRGQLNVAQARWYQDHPLRWHASEIRRGSRSLVSCVVSGARRWLRVARRIDALGGLRIAWRFAASQPYRARSGRLYALRRVRRWHQRGQLGRREAAFLCRMSGHEQSSYLTDFAVHLALKPASKSVTWLLLPLLAQLAILPLWVVPFGLLLGGSIARTAYTVCRATQARLRGLPVPWMALAVGLLPIVGTAAYPGQILATGRSGQGKLAGFLLYDTFTALGRRIPIWGGEDTATEHAFNRFADRIITERSALLGQVGEQ